MTARTKKRIVWSISLAIVFVLLIAIGGPLIPLKRVENWVCSISGSTKREVTLLGSSTKQERTASALEHWLKRREPSFEPQWQRTSTQTYYILGRSCGSSGKPEIYRIKSILDEVVATLSEQRIAELVAVLRHGSRDEQRQIVQSISDEYFNTQ